MCIDLEDIGTLSEGLADPAERIEDDWPCSPAGCNNIGVQVFRNAWWIRAADTNAIEIPGNVIQLGL